MSQEKISKLQEKSYNSVVDCSTWILWVSCKNDEHGLKNSFDIWMNSQRKEQCRFIELFELFNNMKDEMVSETKIIIYKKIVSI